MNHWLDVAALVGLGLFAGGYGTIVGLGGGFLLVPALLLLHFDPRTAAGTSIAVVFANSVSGTVSYLRQKRLDVRTALLFAAAGVPGALLGAALDQVMPQRLFSLLLAVLLVWVSVRMLTTDLRQHDELAGETMRDDEPRPGLRT
ncbi:MAG TPA: sulfite exporter TauE/SafE family protein, partial [Candidatus Eremiobacteraceae bacterium]|nr:sulfite exporter TauE/SafE family protein [Candidatus Eremiobacteraceae bacterium]